MVSTIWRAMRSTGLSDVIGSWNTMAMLVAAQRAHLLARSSPAMSRPRKHDLAADDPAWLLEQPHERQRGHALARARFADDAERLAGRDLEAHAVDRAHDAGVGVELRPQVATSRIGVRPRRVGARPDSSSALIAGATADRASRGCRRPGS